MEPIKSQSRFTIDMINSNKQEGGEIGEKDRCYQRRVAKRCDLQSEDPFDRCQDKECNIGHSVQTDQNDENLSSSQFMSKIEQSVFPTTLLQLKTLLEI